MPTPSIANQMLAAARGLREAVDRLKLRPPVVWAYNPLEYAWRAHEAYLRKFANRPKCVLFLGMNPGPFGMAQTGIPFGEINAVRNWLKIEASIDKPRREHPKRPVEGFACKRSEVSGRRLWGLFAERFGSAESFFDQHMVINYCPLAFFDEEGRNITPDKLPVASSAPLFGACDEHLRSVVRILQTKWLIGVGDFAEKRARQVFAGPPPSVGRILHPSPASPAANRDWARKAGEQLKALDVW